MSLDKVSAHAKSYCYFDSAKAKSIWSAQGVPSLFRYIASISCRIMVSLHRWVKVIPMYEGRMMPPLSCLLIQPAPLCHLELEGRWVYDELLLKNT